jgi:transcriptional regulator with XRE-family HTH domain
VDFRTKMKKVRLEKGFTLAELAQKCDCTASYLQALESGKRSILVNIITVQLAKLLGILPECLITTTIEDAENQKHADEVVITNKSAKSFGTVTVKLCSLLEIDPVPVGFLFYKKFENQLEGKKC